MKCGDIIEYEGKKRVFIREMGIGFYTMGSGWKLEYERAKEEGLIPFVNEEFWWISNEGGYKIIKELEDVTD